MEGVERKLMNNITLYILFTTLISLLCVFFIIYLQDLSARFGHYDVIETDAVLSLDENAKLSKDEVRTSLLRLIKLARCILKCFAHGNKSSCPICLFFPSNSSVESLRQKIRDWKVLLGHRPSTVYVEITYHR